MLKWLGRWKRSVLRLGLYLRMYSRGEGAEGVAAHVQDVVVGINMGIVPGLWLVVLVGSLTFSLLETKCIKCRSQ